MVTLSYKQLQRKFHNNIIAKCMYTRSISELTYNIRSHILEWDLSMVGTLHDVLGTSSDDALVVTEGTAVFARMLFSCSCTGLLLCVFM